MDESGEQEVSALGTELTLSDVVLGKPMQFDVNGTEYALRWPSPEEYDDAMAFQSLVRKREIRRPEIAELKDEPASDSTFLLLRGLIAAAERSFREAEDERHREYWNDQIAGWERALARANLADELADERSALARDRWFTVRLLCHPDGKPYFDIHDKDMPEKWRALPLHVKEAARPVLWRMLRAISEVPF